jgi:hypothetical protein
VDARDVDDHARRVVLEEAADRLARTQEGAAQAAQVDGEHPVEVRGREVLRGARDLDAGVVDQDVDPAQLVDGVGEHADDVVLVRDVSLDEHVGHALLADLAAQGWTCPSVSAASSALRR